MAAASDLDSNDSPEAVGLGACDSQTIERLKLAASLLSRADVLLIAAGAGFSADSGLPTYSGIANVKAYNERGLEYQDLCRPDLLASDPQTFYGFWGDCYHLYKETQPHKGYQILNRWRARLYRQSPHFAETFSQITSARQPLIEDKPVAVSNSPFFIYTSNEWQCSGINSVSSTPSEEEMSRAASNRKGEEDFTPCCKERITLPASHVFTLDKDTKRVDDAKSFPLCHSCSAFLRPAVLMFNDSELKWIGNRGREAAYIAWEAAVEELLEREPSARLVVLEIGCGLRVPSVRLETEMVVRDILSKRAANNSDRAEGLLQSYQEKQAVLIRVNVFEEEAKVEDAALGFGIAGGALETLSLLDKLIDSYSMV